MYCRKFGESLRGKFGKFLNGCRKCFSQAYDTDALE